MGIWKTEKQFISRKRHKHWKKIDNTVLSMEVPNSVTKFRLASWMSYCH